MELMKSVALIAFVVYVLRECQQDPINVAPCTADPNVMYRVCCVFPPFFTREVAKQCGGALIPDFFDEKNNVSGFTRITFDCRYWMCVLDKYAILDSQDNFNIDKYYIHLDMWVELNPLFADVMLEAQVFCKDEYLPSLPLPACSFFNFQSCIRNYIEMDCPIYIETSECLEKKDFLKECKQFFYRKK